MNDQHEGSKLKLIMDQEPNLADDTRRTIVNAAVQMILALGPSLPSIRRIATKAGVSTGTLSYHFPTKGSLLEECLDVLYERLDEVWADALQRVGPGGLDADILNATGTALFSMLRENRNLVRLRILSAMSEGEMPSERVTNYLYRYVSDVSTLLGSETQEVALLFHTIFTIFTRHAAMSGAELRLATGTKTVADAEARMSKHLCTVMIRLLLPNVPLPKG